MPDHGPSATLSFGSRRRFHVQSLKGTNARTEKNWRTDIDRGTADLGMDRDPQSRPLLALEFGRDLHQKFVRVDAAVAPRGQGSRKVGPLDDHFLELQRRGMGCRPHSRSRE